MVEKNDGGEFQSYDKLNITPYHIHKSKREHKLAVFILSKGIALLLSNNNCPELKKISEKLDKVIDCIIAEIENELIIS
jgi:hypothetical protein